MPKEICHTTICGCSPGRTPRFMEPSILLLLSKSPSYGYKLIESLDTKPDAGAVYRILRKLEKDGRVKSNWLSKEQGPARRVYTITAKGKKLLTEWAASIKAKRDSLNKFLSEYETAKKGANQ